MSVCLFLNEMQQDDEEQQGTVNDAQSRSNISLIDVVR